MADETSAVRASDVVTRPVAWLWEPFVPLGKITLLAGQMGQGKSLCSVWLTARASRGELAPNRPGSVLMLSAEDDAADTIVPRLGVAGADLDRVELVSAGSSTLRIFAAAASGSVTWS